ncbi:MAG: hypothetical protein PHF86_07285 [Candidatus Nanoarchaeia archaeon]|jgi:hypothetical protein|nr:hypothetical protein [Candidatus Nanoarchaeia archaeon]
MNVLITDPITISISSAKLIVEDNNRGTIEFVILDQPARINIESSKYTYDIDINVDDRVQLKESFSSFNVGSKGVVKEIIPDNTEDRAKVLFDEIMPDQDIDLINVSINMTRPKILIELPLKILEKI